MPSLSDSPLILAADVGGTHARIAAYRAAPATPQSLDRTVYAKYQCHQFDSFGAVLDSFRKSYHINNVKAVVVATAGIVQKNTAFSCNMPWSVSEDSVVDTLDGLDGEATVCIVNDYQAAMHAIEALQPGDYINLFETPFETPADFSDIIVVLGLGTGLGGAVRLPHTSKATVLTTEIGQTRLKASTDLEHRILHTLAQDEPFVKIEQALSGPGLQNIYKVLARLNNRPLLSSAPADIIARALSKKDDIALQAVQLLAGWLAETLADLSMIFAPAGGIFLAGGLTPSLLPFLQHSDFKHRFFANTTMHSRLAQTPLLVVQRNDLGVLGAASWYIQNH